MSCNEHVEYDEEHIFYLSLNHKDFRVVTITNLIYPDLDTPSFSSPKTDPWSTNVMSLLKKKSEIRFYG